MTLRRFLILAPMAVSLVLALSYCWVPTYEDQTRGNPDRLTQFITTSSGDASMLNPILAADSASSQINNMVFEGLIDRDADLQFRGRVARDWKIYEHALFYVDGGALTRTWGRLAAPDLVARLRALAAGDSGWQHVQSIDLLPPERFTRTAEIETDGQKRAVTLAVDAPYRVRFVLHRVDQTIFDRLGAVLGEAYFDRFDPSLHVTASEAVPAAWLADQARDVLPSTAHHPIIDFFLRDGVTFHDGHPLTAEDVKFTYAAIVDPKNLSPRIPDYEPVQSVTVLDPLTVRIVYKRLYSPAFASWSMGILPAHLLSDAALAREAAGRGMAAEKFTMRQSRFNRHPVGCGPFVFDGWKSDQYLRLRRFDAYWEGPPNYQEYVMRIVPDALTQEMEFYAGTIDDYNVLPHQVARLSKDARFQLFSGTAFGYTYIGYNLRRAPFDDVRVRRALGMAIDTRKIIDYVLYGQGETITGPFAKQTDFYDHGIQPLPHDPEGARKLLAEAGWRPGRDGFLEKEGKRLAFTLITNNGNDLRKAILAIAQDAWRKIGIQVETDLLEWSVFIQKRINTLDFDATVLGWSMGIDPDLYQIWHSSQTGPYQLNFVGFANPRADDLILKIRREYDHDRQVAYCRQLHAMIAAEQPYTFLYVGRWTALLDRRIVRRMPTAAGDVYQPIVPTKTGSYTFHFNQWIKLNRRPDFSAAG